jgi:hypothetical protein
VLCDTTISARLRVVHSPRSSRGFHHANTKEKPKKDRKDREKIKERLRWQPLSRLQIPGSIACIVWAVISPSNNSTLG